MLHATSQNVLRVERAITNPAVHLKEPMNFNRPNPADFSPVELAILRGLGKERYDFKTDPRAREDYAERSVREGTGGGRRDVNIAPRNSATCRGFKFPSTRENPRQIAGTRGTVGA